MTVKTVTLTTPIEAHGEKLSELKLRKPTTAELIEHGQPYTTQRGGVIKADYRVCAALISAICAIPPSSVDKLEPSDFDEAAMSLVGFMSHAPGGGANASGSAAKS